MLPLSQASLEPHKMWTLRPNLRRMCSVAPNTINKQRLKNIPAVFHFWKGVCMQGIWVGMEVEEGPECRLQIKQKQDVSDLGREKGGIPADWRKTTVLHFGAILEGLNGDMKSEGRGKKWQLCLRKGACYWRERLKDSLWHKKGSQMMKWLLRCEELLLQITCSQIHFIV